MAVDGARHCLPLRVHRPDVGGQLQLGRDHRGQGVHLDERGGGGGRRGGRGGGGFGRDEEGAYGRQHVLFVRLSFAQHFWCSICDMTACHIRIIWARRRA